jgi:hypothetical protein
VIDESHAKSAAADTSRRPPPLELPIPHLSIEGAAPVDKSADVFTREGWASLLMTVAEPAAQQFLARIGMLWIRPDGFAGGDPGNALSVARTAGFRPVAAAPATLDRPGVRQLWSAVMWQATMEGLWLLEAIAGLGPGLVILLADDSPERATPASCRLTRLKGPGDVRRRPAGCLRQAIGSPDAALTMVHSADDPYALLRELAVLTDWQDRTRLIEQAWLNLNCGQSTDLRGHFADCALRRPGPAGERAVAASPPPPGPLVRPTWPLVQAAARTWQLSRTPETRVLR